MGMIRFFMFGDLLDDLLIAQQSRSEWIAWFFKRTVVMVVGCDESLKRRREMNLFLNCLK